MAPKLAVAFLLASAVFAQQWEVGGAVGYGWNRNARFTGPGGQADAGIDNRATVGAVLTEDLYEHLSGEIRYMYSDGDPFLRIAGRTATIRGQSHSFTYDSLFHVRSRDHRLRPFFAAGIGAKYFRTTGTAPGQQPAPGVALLSEAEQWRLLVSVGFGVSYRFPNHLLLRADFRDYISPTPKKLFAPAGGATGGGLMHQFTPMVGVGFWF